MNENLTNVFRRVESYTPGEQPNTPGMIKLNTNENPYPPSPYVLDAIKRFSADKLALYPDPEAVRLKEALGELHQLPPDYFFVGNGSDEILALIFMAFFNDSKPVLFPDVTYSFYKVWCSLFRVLYREIPLDENFKIRCGDYKNCGGVVIANPNAPTGISLNEDDMLRIIENNPDIVVVVDEAYIDFGGKSCMEHVEKYDNLIVVRTFSKSRSLAGLRVGYAACQKHLADVLNTVKHSFNSYTVNRISQAAAQASVTDKPYFEQTIAQIIETREWFIKELIAKRYAVLPSAANFVFASPPYKKASEVFYDLREQNIYVRYFEKNRIDNFLRITIGSNDDMKKLLYHI